MLHFRTLDVYRCAVAFLPMAYAISKNLDVRIVSMLTKMIG